MIDFCLYMYYTSHSDASVINGVSPILWVGPQFLAVGSYFLGTVIGLMDICIGDSMTHGRVVCSIPVSSH